VLHRRTFGKIHTKPFSFTFLINLVAEKRFLLRSGFVEVSASYSRETQSHCRYSTRTKTRSNHLEHAGKRNQLQSSNKLPILRRKKKNEIGSKNQKTN